MTAIRQQYLNIKRQYPDAIVFFRLGDFYETFDQDAKTTSQELDITLTSRSMGKGNRIPLAGIPYHAIDNYLIKLINKGYKVAICEQVSQSGGGRKLIEREVIRVVTPGTIIEPNMLEVKANNYLVSVVAGEDGVGLAYVDITTSEFAVTQMTEEQALSELARIQPSEILGYQEFPWLSDRITLVDEQWFDLDTCRLLLLDHFQAESLEGYGCANLPMAIQAAGVILHYLKETQRDVLRQITRLSTYSTESFMILDPQTRRNLELFKTNRTGAVGGSLLSVIDLTKIPMGGRLLRKWLGQPLLEIDEIKQRQDGIAWFYEDSVRRTRVIDLLSNVGDLERIINRIRLGVAMPRELLSLKRGLSIIPELKEIMIKDNYDATRLISELKSCSDVTTLLSEAISEDPFGLVGDGGIIKKGFSVELDEIRSISIDAKKYIAGLERSERERTGIKSLKIGYNKVFGYYIEVTTPNLSQIPDDYIRKQTLVNGERYFTTQLKEYESIIFNATSKVSELETGIYRQVCNQIAGSAEIVLGVASALAQIDVLSSLGEVAVRNGYVKPEVYDNDSIIIKEGRHPVVERYLEGESFVPNDSVLSNEDTQLIILTGPNMAGKSTYLRQVALLVLMTQIGSFIPAESAEIGLVDRIFTRIGAQEDIAAGQSTFMVEMVETANILNNATPKSLIILDEIGRGTSTYDGLSIAHAVVEYIHNHPMIGAKTIFATHFHELVELAKYLPRVKNFNVAVAEEEGTVVFLRKIISGGADKSYGIHVAQLAGVPKPVLHRAEEVLEDLEGDRSQQEIRARKGRSKRKPLPQQLALLGQGSTVVDELTQLDLSSMTPLEAITKLYELQKKAAE